MNIVIVAHFCADFSENDNGRFSYLADMLAKEHDVEIITSDFFHTTKEFRKEVPQHAYKITLLHEPGYQKNVTPGRFLSHIEWGKNVKAYLETRDIPDVIYCAIPSLSAADYVSEYCEKNSVRFVIDIQDLWPEAFQMVFNVPVLSDLAFMPFRKKADRIYSRADAICAVSKTYVWRAKRVNGTASPCHHVFLGTDLGVFDQYAKGEPILHKEEGEFWIAYCGTLGSSYDLTCVIEAMKSVPDNAKLIVMGDGPRKEEFESLAKDVNAVFTGRLPYNEMCALLCACDATVNPITHNAAQSIINKHADYAASGLPVISTQENEEYKALVQTYRMGFNCKNNNAAQISSRINILMQDKLLRERMGKNARKCAEEMFDRRNTYKYLIEAITGENHAKRTD